MQIHLSKPGGQREGPYTLEQINQALENRKLDGNQYWAWYEGLDSWVPLYSVPGVKAHREATKSETAGYDTQFLAPSPGETAESAPEPFATASAPPEVPPTDTIPMTAGMPFSALEQIFILTTGEGPAASRSPVTASLLRDVIGEDWETIRQFVPRDAIARCAVLNEMDEGSIPPLVWRAMTAFKPVLLQQAQAGSHRICIRSFKIETGDLVSVFLFYNKEKLK